MLNIKKRELGKKMISYGIFIIIMYLWHIRFAYMCDDEVIRNGLLENGYFDKPISSTLILYVSSRWRAIGKIFTDGLAAFFLRENPSLWIAFDIVVWFLIFHFTCVLLDIRDNKGRVFVFLLFGCFPYSYLSTAGYIITSTNYVYPWLGILIIGVLVKRLNDLDDRRILPIIIISWLFIAICALYVCNQDQYGLISIGLCIVALFKRVFDKKRIKSVLICLGILVLSYSFSFFIPGHILRMSDTNSWIPDFDQWSILRKLTIGYSSTVANLYFNRFLPVMLFYLALCIYAFLKEKGRTLAVLMTGTVGIFFLLHPSVQSTSEIAQSMPELLISGSDYITNGNHPGLMIVSISMVIGTVILLKKLYKEILLTITFMGAGASRIIMGFSNSLYASSYRTFVPLTYIVLSMIAVIYKKCEGKNSIQAKELLLAIVGTGSFLYLSLTFPLPF